MRVFIGGQHLNASKCLYGLFIDVLPGFFLDILLLLERISISSNKVPLRLANPFKLFFDDGVRNVFFTVGSLHAFHVERVEHTLPMM